MIRRVCLFGGPGASKSTQAAFVFHNLKVANYNAELIQEYIKSWCYEGRPPRSLDQWYVFSKQMHREDIVLRPVPETDKPIVDVIVTDSPLFLQCTYAYLHRVPGAGNLLNFAKIVEKMYPSINIFIERPKEYKSEGRWQTEKEAQKVDKNILKMLDKWKVPHYKIAAENKYLILDKTLSALGSVTDRSQ